MSEGVPQQLLLGFQLDKSATLENFQVAAKDEQLMLHLQENVIPAGEFLTFLWGGRGTGKTHLLQALCHELSCMGGTAMYLPLTATDQVAPPLLDGLDQLDLVCLDDIGAVAGNDAWEAALFNLYNRARSNDCCLVLTAGVPPVELPLNLADLRSRLQSGVVFQLHELSDQGKAELIRHRAAALGIQLPPPVLNYILQRHDRQTAALLHLLQELDKWSLERKRPITIPLVRQLLKR